MRRSVIRKARALAEVTASLATCSQRSAPLHEDGTNSHP